MHSESRGSARPTLAVLGGGQLGRMLALAGVPLGVRFRFLDPSPDAPAQELGPLTVGGLGEPAALRAVADGADVATYEWEGLPADAARLVAATGVPVWPPPDALDVAQDRLVEKTCFQALAIPVSAFAPVGSPRDVDRAIDAVGLPAVLKTRRGGYDGKGQVVLREASEPEAGWIALGRVPAILESLVPFDRELSIIAARDRDGVTVCWPLVENRHASGILRESRAPAPGLTAELQAAAESCAARLLDDLGYVGVLALELFQVGDRLVANEMAPRVHNSGHWTIEGAVTSQFENHVRAVLGWPLGPTDAIGVSAMVNCIGALPDPAAVLALPGAHLHRYGKSPRFRRKVGHVTVVASDLDELDARLAALRAVLPPDDG